MRFSGTPGKTIRLVVGGIERGQQELNADGSATFVYDSTVMETQGATASFGYLVDSIVQDEQSFTVTLLR